jgi:hypothetical protein
MGTPDAAVVAVERVNELDFYRLGAKQLAKKVNLTMPKAIAACGRLASRLRDFHANDLHRAFRATSTRSAILLSL